MNGPSGTTILEKGYTQDGDDDATSSILHYFIESVSSNHLLGWWHSNLSYDGHRDLLWPCIGRWVLSLCRGPRTTSASPGHFHDISDYKILAAPDCSRDLSRDRQRSCVHSYNGSGIDLFHDETRSCRVRHEQWHSDRRCCVSYHRTAAPGSHRNRMDSQSYGFCLLSKCGHCSCSD